MKEEILDKIDRYLRKEMTSEETAAFEQELQQDASLREEVELTKDIIGRLKDRQEKLEQMKKWDREYAGYRAERAIAEPERTNAATAYEAVMPRSGKKNRTIVWISSIGIAACLIAGVFMIRPNYDRSISNDEINSPIVGSYRGTFFTHEIQDLITRGKNEQALVLIDSLEENYKKEAMQYHEEEALTEEESYVLQTNALAMYELEWLRIKALIGGKQYKEAFEVLGKYRLQEGDYQEKADSLWNELKERLVK